MCARTSTPPAGAPCSLTATARAASAWPLRCQPPAASLPGSSCWGFDGIRQDVRRLAGRGVQPGAVMRRCCCNLGEEWMQRGMWSQTQHLGDSGSTSRPASCSTAGTADTPSIHLHQCARMAACHSSRRLECQARRADPPPGAWHGGQSPISHVGHKLAAGDGEHLPAGGRLRWLLWEYGNMLCHHSRAAHIERHEGGADVLASALCNEHRGHAGCQTNAQAHQHAPCIGSSLAATAAWLQRPHSSSSATHR